MDTKRIAAILTAVAMLAMVLVAPSSPANAGAPNGGHWRGHGGPRYA